jgi:NodT family efflux transporter outer membrane factor (OMF) lipoprotein
MPWKKPFSVLVLACSAAVLAGCVSVPALQTDKEQAKAVPAEWVTKYARPAGAVAPEIWWQSWNDACLEGLIDQALKNNTNIRVAQANLRAAAASLTVADAALFPVLTGSGSGERSHAQSRGSNSAGISLNGSWTIDAGGNLAAAKAAEALMYSEEASLGDVLVGIAGQVATAYINAMLNQRQLEIALENAVTQAESLKIAEWRYRAGLVDSTDVDQARTSLAQTEALIPQYRAYVAQYRNTLSRLVGVPAEQISLPQKSQIPAAPENLAVQIPGEVLRGVPAVRVSEMKLLAALAQKTVAESALYPSLQIGGKFGLSASSIGALGDSGTHVSSIFGTLTLPIFNAGALRAQVESADAQIDAARANYEASLLLAVSNVEDALNALLSAQSRVKSLTVAVSSAQSAAQQARQNYEAGLQDFTVVLTTQKSLLTVEESKATAQADIAKSLISLYQALGGGWKSQLTSSGNASESAQKTH